jgi:predicted alpha/beta hydrolase
VPRDHHDVGIASPEVSGGARATAAAGDGHPLAITRFTPAGEAWGTVLIAGAMGVRQDFYAPLASWLASQGLHALTFDYRGMGWSRSGGLRGFQTDISKWIEQDADAMLREAAGVARGKPLFLLGHSLGGQIFAVLPGAERVAACVTVTAGSGYYRFNDRMPAQVRFFWFGAVPILTALFGYFPGKPLKMVGDLPGGVARQWRRWCVHPEYLLAEGPSWREAFQRVRAPILAWSFEDDAIVTRKAIDSLHGFYRDAPVERRHVVPVGKRMGHFGFFAPSSLEGAWRETLAWLRERVR